MKKKKNIKNKVQNKTKEVYENEDYEKIFNTEDLLKYADAKNWKRRNKWNEVKSKQQLKKNIEGFFMKSNWNKTCTS